MARIAINGFGRIGRQVFKAIYMDEEYSRDLEIVAVNDLTNPDTLAHLLKYDSTYGIFDAEVSSNDGTIHVDETQIRVCSERDPGSGEKAPCQGDLSAQL